MLRPWPTRLAVYSGCPVGTCAIVLAPHVSVVVVKLVPPGSYGIDIVSPTAPNTVRCLSYCVKDFSTQQVPEGTSSPLIVTDMLMSTGLDDAAWVQLSWRNPRYGVFATTWRSASVVELTLAHDVTLGVHEHTGDVRITTGQTSRWILAPHPEHADDPPLA